MKSFITGIILLNFCCLFMTAGLMAQSGISGIVRDKKSGETIVGANVIVKGSTRGASTGIDGSFSISGLQAGNLTLIVSFISYKPIELSFMLGNGEYEAGNIFLEEEISTLQGVTVKERRKTDTDISLVSSIRNSNLVVSGISAQQISRSTDRDAAEVMKRVPGVTIMNNRFVVVRGLTERYNSVWLNNAATAGTETDVKAFSFDIIPSSLIDNILVYKTPAPELPGDFAGASVHIFTKNLPERNSISFSYSSGLRSGTTFGEFYTYAGGKYDFLGFDDGSRALPDGFPSYHLSEISKTAEGKKYRQDVGRSLSKIWEPFSKNAGPDHRLLLTSALKFKISNAFLNNITSVNYSNSRDFRQVFRANYLSYDRINDISDTAYFFNDEVYSETSRAGILHNWSYIFGNGQALEFRNMFTQTGSSKTTLSSGKDFYGGQTLKAHELDYMERVIYTGQLGGKHRLGNDHDIFDWTLGYSHSSREQPDLRRITTVKNEDQESPYYGMYGVNFNFTANSDQNGRIFTDMKENIYAGGMNLTMTLLKGNFRPELKAGVYAEEKKRNFKARLLGYAIAKTSSFDWSLPYQPLDYIFADTNINNTTGIRIDEQTNPLDSYTASNLLYSAYTGIKVPVTPLFTAYVGLRAESNSYRLISGDEKTPVETGRDTLNFFPSINLSWQIREKITLRAAFGQTINRPEFREIAPFNFFVYDMKAYYKGNPSLKDAYIDNYDLRLEFYPGLYEMISIGFFYKKFRDPIEATMYSAGSGWDYTFRNAESSYSTGLEADIRASLASLKNLTHGWQWLRSFSIVSNISIIKSEISTSDVYARSGKRPMQGQSPYIVNTGLFYNNDSLGLGVSIQYNIIGRRIVYTGTVSDPHTWELPRNLLDLSVVKNIGNNLQCKAGLSDVFRARHRLVQYENIEKDMNGDGIADRSEESIQTIRSFRTGRYFTLGFTLQF
jgi:hypothetical protein